MSTHDLPASLRILVVEDEAIIADEISHRLSRRGAIILGPVDTAERAISTAIESKPDLILMDIRLKGAMDGIDAASAIHQRLDVPVVFLTANADEATFRRAQTAAEYGYVLKPFHERDLMLAIELAMHRHGIDREMRRSQLTHAAISRHMSEAVMAIDADARIRYLNPAASALIGWTLDEAAGRALSAVINLRREADGEVLEFSALSSDDPHSPTTRHVALLTSRDGVAIPVDLAANAILGSGNTVAGVVISLRDLRAEREAQERLRDSEKMAAIGQLAGGIAHDFNNLLTVIQGCSNLLLDHVKRDDGEEHELVASIHDAGARAVLLTRQLLHFARRAPPSIAHVEPNVAIQNIAAMLQRLIGEDIALSTQLEPQLPGVRMDATHFEQVLLNLIVNARDAMPRGGQLTIRTSLASIERARAAATAPPVPDSPYCIVEVRDVGAGIAPADLRRIFEPYFTTKQVGKGTGLGLATTYALVSSAGGFITVESVLGRGTSFLIWLPVSTESPLTTTNTPASAPAVDASERILLVEDEAAVRNWTARVLRRRGYVVLEASSATEALDLLIQRGERVDLLLTDVVMPGLSGGELATTVRSRWPSLPVIFMSGYHNDEVVRAGAETVGSLVLDKPFTAAVLEQSVRTVLDTAPQRMRDAVSRSFTR